MLRRWETESPRKKHLSSSLKDDQERKWGKMFPEKKQGISKAVDAAHKAGFDVAQQYHLWNRERVK